MRKKLRNLLCKVGLHKWGNRKLEKVENKVMSVYYLDAIEECKRCPKTQRFMLDSNDWWY